MSKHLYIRSTDCKIRIPMHQVRNVNKFKLFLQTNQIANVAVPVDHRVKRKVKVRKNCTRIKKSLERESKSLPIITCTRKTISKALKVKLGNLEMRQTVEIESKHGIAEVYKNTDEGTGDFMRLAVTQFSTITT